MQFKPTDFNQEVTQVLVKMFIDLENDLTYPNCASIEERCATIDDFEDSLIEFMVHFQ